MEYYLALKRKATDTRCNMVELWKHYAKLNEPDTKGQIVYDAILQGTKTGKFIEMENRIETPGLDGGKNMELLCDGCGVFIWNDELDTDGSWTTLEMCLMPLNCMLKSS